MLDRIKDEPAILLGLISAAIALVNSFGGGITADQTDSIITLVTSLLVLAFGTWRVRQNVTPNRKLRK